MTNEKSLEPSSPLPWREGKVEGVLVCDNPEHTPYKGHLKYYGRHPVCESMTPADRAFVLAKVNPPEEANCKHPELDTVSGRVFRQSVERLYHTWFKEWKEANAQIAAAVLRDYAHVLESE